MRMRDAAYRYRLSNTARPERPFTLLLSRNVQGNLHTEGFTTLKIP